MCVKFSLKIQFENKNLQIYMNMNILFFPKQIEKKSKIHIIPVRYDLSYCKWVGVNTKFTI